MINQITTAAMIGKAWGRYAEFSCSSGIQFEKVKVIEHNPVWVSDLT